MSQAGSNVSRPDEADLDGPGAVRLLEIDIAVEAGEWPAKGELEPLARGAIHAALDEIGARSGASEVSLVFTDDDHIRALNASWRGKDRPTNVLSFPAFLSKRSHTLPPMLGDIVLASETIGREATLEEKPFNHHLTHLIIHGLLHLMGYDHETEEDAEEMEAVERRALARLAIPDPYA
jgi:probable rRNA maturation factor